MEGPVTGGSRDSRTQVIISGQSEYDSKQLWTSELNWVALFRILGSQYDTIHLFCSAEGWTGEGEVATSRIKNNALRFVSLAPCATYA